MTAFFFDNKYCEKIDLLLSTNRPLRPYERCPFCSSWTKYIHEVADDGHDYYNREIGSHVCNSCGYWVWHKLVEYDNNEWDEDYIYRSALKQFDLDDKLAPQQAINKWLRYRPDDASKVHPRKLELAIKDILSEHFDCEFCFTRETRDNGITILAYEKESERFLVEVKRNTFDRKIDANFVGEFAGVLVRGNRNQGLIATTGEISPSAKENLIYSPTAQKHKLIIDHMSVSELLYWLRIRDSGKAHYYSDSYWKEIIYSTIASR